jgi:single-stranded-DNA-specific exonuclease
MIVERGLDRPERRSIVLARENWHGGVLGIVASRIVETFYRPTVLISTPVSDGGRRTTEDGPCPAQGSARSIPGFPLRSALQACSRHLVKFGGHKMAAGITIEPAKIDQFAAEFEAYAGSNLTQDDVIAKLHIDAVAPLAEFSKDLVGQLQVLEPFGAGNPEPVFATKGVRLACPPRKVGARLDHLQLAITDNSGSVRCIGFSMAQFDKKLLDREFFNVAYHPHINTYNGYSNVEFILADIQFD